jgi:hypothetical protein
MTSASSIVTRGATSRGMRSKSEVIGTPGSMAHFLESIKIPSRCAVPIG